ncbi:MAG: metalloregulator ArsR/SmtB family transcription factor [Sandaracinaceae bacterium]|nr:metalloregulator ArsR/SmtB family transcription factor [Sandaracinaceae bacterium]
MRASLATTTELLSALADPVRLRLVALLAKHELSVAEVQETLDLAQSRASSHLAMLREAGLVRVRREGRNALYATDLEAMGEGTRALWSALSAGLEDQLLVSDARRADVIVRRRTGAWAETVAGEMERHYSPGRTWEATARGLLGLSQHGDVLDVGSGDGTLAALLAPVSKSVTLLDASERMVEAARRRLDKHAHARVAQGDAEALPFADASFDVVMLFNVLASLARPERAVAECARVLRVGGRVVLVTLAAHEHLELVQRFGHRRAGFRVAELAALLRRAGLETELCEITSREKREPCFDVITAYAHKPAHTPSERRSQPPRSASTRPGTPPSRSEPPRAPRPPKKTGTRP